MFILYLTKQIKNPCRLVIKYNYNKEVKQECEHLISLKKDLILNLIINSSNLCKQAKNALPLNYSDLGELVSIDGALIDAVLSMRWADYRKGAKKAKGQTGIMDRGYQSHKDFDLLQDEKKHFVCRIQAKTTRIIIKDQPVRVVGYKIAGVKHFVATDRYDLTADQVATV